MKQHLFCAKKDFYERLFQVDSSVGHSKVILCVPNMFFNFFCLQRHPATKNPKAKCPTCRSCLRNES